MANQLDPNDVTPCVETGEIDDENMPITKCLCGARFAPWSEVLSIYKETPWECPECGVRLIFRASVRVLRVGEAARAIILRKESPQYYYGRNSYGAAWSSCKSSAKRLPVSEATEIINSLAAKGQQAWVEIHPDQVPKTETSPNR